MRLLILTPEFSREIEADAVFFPGTLCPFEVLPGHAPLISTLSEGEVRWRVGSEEESLAIKGGAVQVDRNEIKLCAEL